MRTLFSYRFFFLLLLISFVSCSDEELPYRIGRKFPVQNTSFASLADFGEPDANTFYGILLNDLDEAETFFARIDKGEEENFTPSMIDYGKVSLVCVWWSVMPRDVDSVAWTGENEFTIYIKEVGGITQPLLYNMLLPLTIVPKLPDGTMIQVRSTTSAETTVRLQNNHPDYLQSYCR